MEQKPPYAGTDFYKSEERVDKIDRALENAKTYPLPEDNIDRLKEEKAMEQEIQRELLEEYISEAHLVNTIINLEEKSPFKNNDTPEIEDYIFALREKTLDNLKKLQDSSDTELDDEMIDNIAFELFDILESDAIDKDDLARFDKKIIILKSLAGNLRKQADKKDTSVIEKESLVRKINIIKNSLEYESGKYYKKSEKSFPSQFFFRATYATSSGEIKEIKVDISRDIKKELDITMLTNLRREIIANSMPETVSIKKVYDEKKGYVYWKVLEEDLISWANQVKEEMPKNKPQLPEKSAEVIEKRLRHYADIPTNVLRPDENGENGQHGPRDENIKPDKLDEARFILVEGQPDFLFSVPVENGYLEKNEYLTFFLKNCAILESKKIGNAAFILEHKIENVILEKLNDKSISEQEKKELYTKIRNSFNEQYSKLKKSQLALVGDRITHQGKDSDMILWINKMYYILNKHMPYGQLRLKFLKDFPNVEYKKKGF